MEYIHSDTGIIDFERYLLYVETIRDKLPEHIYLFASDSRYFDLESPSSFHDAWLETLTVKENIQGRRQHLRDLNIHLRLLAPFHDRYICVQYLQVQNYQFLMPSAEEDGNVGYISHGDLFTHEIRLSENGSLIHEMLFQNGAKFFIECLDIKHSEEPVPELN